METELYHPVSWAKNRSKWLCLHTLTEAKPDNEPSFEWVYVNSSIPYWTLAGGFPKWERWGYISKDDDGLYTLRPKGRNFLNKMQEQCDACQKWIQELSHWRETAATSNATMSAMPGISNITGAREAVRAAPWLLYFLPAAVGFVAVVVVLKGDG